MITIFSILISGDLYSGEYILPRTGYAICAGHFSRICKTIYQCPSLHSLVIKFHVCKLDNFKHVLSQHEAPTVFDNLLT